MKSGLTLWTLGFTVWYVGYLGLKVQDVTADVEDGLVDAVAEEERCG